MRRPSCGQALFRSRSGFEECSRARSGIRTIANDTGQDFRIPATADCNDGRGKLLEDSRQLDRPGRPEGAQRQPGSERCVADFRQQLRLVAGDYQPHRISSTSAWITTSPPT